MLDILIYVLAIPCITSAAVMLMRRPGIVSWLNLAGSVATAGLLFELVRLVAAGGGLRQGFFLVDELSALFLLIVGLLSLTAAVYSFFYMRHELEDGRVSSRLISRYYALLQLFVLTMIFTLVVNNLGLIWVAVEATTLISALLVAYYTNRSAIEAAWKYVMVCSVGIAMALLGTILFYYAQVQAGPADVQALSWLEMHTDASRFNPDLVRLSAVFLMIGYGTKAGLAPMHTWLPDAHSQAPTPVSGLLSGALLSCAMYAIARNLAIINLLPEVAGFTAKLLTGFGLLSIAVAVPFLLLQHDIKRLLAYSSVEHMGIAALGFGTGAELGFYGALLHLLNHAVGKSGLFYLSGILIQQYRTKQILRIRGLIRVAPVAGGLMIALIMAVSGMPPFGIFLSKFITIQAMFAGGSYLAGTAALVLLAGVFTGMVYYTFRIVFGDPPAGMEAKPQSWGMLAVVVVSTLLLTVTGFQAPAWLDRLISAAAQIVSGGLRG